MATDQEPPVYPGDIIQDADGLLYLVTETPHGRVGAVLRWRAAGRVAEAYFRFRGGGDFVVVGTAHLTPAEVAAARRDALTAAREVAREALDHAPLSDTCDPFQWAVNAVSEALARRQDPLVAIAEAAQEFASLYPGVAREIGR